MIFADINTVKSQPIWFETITHDENDNSHIVDSVSFNLDIFTNGSTVDEDYSYTDSMLNMELLFGQRSSRSTLADRNIIKDSHVAPVLQATSESIRKKKISEYLEHKLEHRRSKEDLISANIIKQEMKSPSNALSLQPVQSQLKFHRTQIELSQKLEYRPDISELITSNIIKADVAPNLQAAQQALKFQRTSITMDHKLEHRPSVSELVGHNILKLGGIEVASNLHAAQQQLKFNIISATLDHKLENRPNHEVLVEHHIIMEDDSIPNSHLDSEKKNQNYKIILINNLKEDPVKNVYWMLVF